MKGLGVGIVVEVEGGANGFFEIAGGEIVFEDDGLTSTGITDKEHTLLGHTVNIDKELLASRLGSGDDQVVE